jgi:hypothetical protein
MVEYKINDNIEPGELDKFFHGFKYKKEEVK